MEECQNGANPWNISLVCPGFGRHKEPERPIIDPHHHLWFGWDWEISDCLLVPHAAPAATDTMKICNQGRMCVAKVVIFVLEDLRGDTESGHKIEKTVFIECSANYSETGPDHLKPVGETVFVADIAVQSAAESSPKAVIAGIVSHADLTLSDALNGVLDAQSVAGRGLFRGIRHAGAHHPYSEEAFLPGRYPVGLFFEEDFQAGVRLLGRHGYTYDSWHYHTQSTTFTRLPQGCTRNDHYPGSLWHAAGYQIIQRPTQSHLPTVASRHRQAGRMH